MSKSISISIIFAFLLTIGLLNYFLFAQLIGPDFFSYTLGLKNGLKTWMVTEIVSWWLISNFTHSYFHLWIFVTLLQTAFIISLIIFCIKSQSDKRLIINYCY